MTKILLGLLTFATLTACNNSAKTNFNNEALQQTLASVDGNQVLFADILKKHEGKTVLIEFWATWCGDCLKAMPAFEKLQEKHPEVDYVFVSLDKTTEKWLAGIEKHQIVGDHYMANDGMKGVFGKAVDLDWIPRYIVLDKTGKILIYRAIESDFDQLYDTLAKQQ